VLATLAVLGVARAAGGRLDPRLLLISGVIVGAFANAAVMVVLADAPADTVRDALVLDEPTTFLDVAHEMAVFELADRLARAGRAVLLVSHQLNLVARFADHIVLLHRGRVAAAGTAARVMEGATLERVYEWPLVVTRDPAVGAPSLVPLRARPRA